MAAFEHYIDNRIDIFRLLRFLPNLGKKGVPADTFVKFVGRETFFWLVTHQANLEGMHEVVTMSQIYLVILELDPHKLLDELIPPLLHYLQGGVKLTV